MDTNTLTPTAVEEIAKLAAAAETAEVFQPEELGLEGQIKGPLVVLPKGAEIQSLEAFQEEPVRITQTFIETASFCVYVERYKLPDTLLHVYPGAFKFRAIIDYHKQVGNLSAEPQKDSATAIDQVQPCQHIAVLELRKSEAFKAWDGEVFNEWIAQATLAEWLEDHAHQVTSPDSGDILTIARELDVAKDQQFTSHQRANDGDFNFSYNEKTTGHVENLEVPGKITIAIPIFVGDAQETIECLLRYRMRSGELRFCIRPLRLEETIRANLETVQAIVEQSTGLIPLASA